MNTLGDQLRSASWGVQFMWMRVREGAAHGFNGLRENARQAWAFMETIKGGSAVLAGEAKDAIVDQMGQVSLQAQHVQAGAMVRLLEAKEVAVELPMIRYGAMAVRHVLGFAGEHMITAGAISATVMVVVAAYCWYSSVEADIPPMTLDAFAEHYGRTNYTAIEFRTGDYSPFGS